MARAIETLKPKHFKAMALLEAKYYSEDFITDWEDAYDWYLYSRDTCIAVEEDNQLVGFMNLFPVSKAFYDKIATGKDHDGFLELEDVLRISDEPSGCYNLFLSCIVVDDAYRKSNALETIIGAYLSRYQAHCEHGAKIEYIITHNVTAAGRRFSERMGFKQVLQLADGSTVAEVSYLDFVRVSTDEKRYMP